MGMSKLKLAQLAAATAGMSRTFTARNPGQDRYAAGLEDSAKGAVMIETAKKAKKDAEKKKKKKSVKNALYDVGQIALAVPTAGASLPFTQAAKGTVMGLTGGAQESGATGGIMDMYSAYKGGGGGGTTPSVKSFPSNAIATGNPDASSYFGKGTPSIPLGGFAKAGASAPTQDPMALASRGGAPASPQQIISQQPASLQAALPPNEIKAMAPEGRIQYALSRQRSGQPMTAQELAQYTNEEVAELKMAGIEMPSFEQRFGQNAQAAYRQATSQRLTPNKGYLVA